MWEGWGHEAFLQLYLLHLCSQVIICPTSISLISHGHNTTIINRQNSFISGTLKPYWLHVDREDGILSLGDYGARKPIFEYDFSDHFDDFFIDYFALAGSGHWIVQFLSGITVG